ncbi:putative enoyl-CoA hydratase echA12 [Zhongshania aliphaticivorans]|uniref:Putative enoyl-CoA hydratase echA12 n=1 Tax=Zhongshania aliphaticivorans TaxID=1470434 RepID=A0A5S9NS39_9GAMM|nr:enoyl-CoA hydratase-related protein [Zhongshania aliphaticivorans]CAA0093364.1 putative enoyl-CoA hydratase echA12 [Zhongshania aliphaticivorans]CAA0111207.1 putative enoyl-CoA hydratase echA12 [Zhongshania aliphaticivorans]
MNEFEPQATPYETILVTQEQDMEVVTLNRPKALNSMNPLMMLELQHYFASLRYRQEVRVVLLKSEGKHFCAGLDISPEFAVDISSGSEGMRIQNRVAEIIKLMRACPQPIIAMIQGAACGGGFSLALAADVRIAEPQTKMNTAFTQVGFSACDVGSSYFLTRMLGTSVASELMLTGRYLLADRALSLGFVSAVVEKDQMENEARAIAADMLKVSPMGLRLTKDGINVNVDAGSLSAAISLEDRQQILCGLSDDHHEALAAFREKRTPDYSDK